MMMRKVAAALSLSAVLSIACVAWALDPGDRAASGKPLKVSSYRGKVLVIDFWASWCKPCLKELPALDALAKKYKTAGKDVVIIAVNIDKDRKNAEKFLKSAKVSTLTVVYDPSGSMAEQYDVPTMPSSYVVDKKGIIRHVHEGYTTGDERKLEREINALLK
jgi:thiol-disulfide isomerase/thioredoxin